MEVINSIILAIVQGITEFLPISSSGHLAILQNFFGEVNVSFDIFLHLATLLSILVYFSKDIFAIIKDFISFKTKSENFKLALYLIIASVPAALFGFWLKSSIDSIFSNIIFIAIGFIISGLFLFLASFVSKNENLNIKNTFIVGVAQALAILPGISRSGSTVSIGLLLGLKREVAIKFSFLLAIPAILGASVLQLGEFNFTPFLIIPLVITFLTGLFAIHIFLTKIKSRNLKYFAYYCWIVALLILIIKFL
jgi:undecaprenyl-diphosphatase